MRPHRDITGPEALIHHIENGEARYGQRVFLELHGESFEGNLSTTGTDVYVQNENREYLVYSHLFPLRIAWNFMSLSYLEDSDE